MKKCIVILTIFLVFIFGCTQTGVVSVDNKSIENDGNVQGNAYSLEEVALHNVAEDCWMIINGNVYDVTGFIAFHPGGNTILQGCGKDATEFFETRPMGSGTPHSTGARNKADTLKIGVGE